MQLTCTCKYKKGNILHYYTCTLLENGENGGERQTYLQYILKVISIEICQIVRHIV